MIALLLDIPAMGAGDGAAPGVHPKLLCMQPLLSAPNIGNFCM